MVARVRPLRELGWCLLALLLAALLLSAFYGFDPREWWSAIDEPDPDTRVNGPVVVVLLPLSLWCVRLAWLLPPRVAARRWWASFAVACLLLFGIATALTVLMLRVVTAWDLDPDGGFAEYLRLRWLCVGAVALLAIEGLGAGVRTWWAHRRRPRAP